MFMIQGTLMMAHPHTELSYFTLHSCWYAHVIKLRLQKTELLRVCREMKPKGATVRVDLLNALIKMVSGDQKWNKESSPTICNRKAVQVDHMKEARSAAWSGVLCRMGMLRMEPAL
jgi:hypothetical protein